MTDMTDKVPHFFIEENIINSVKKFLSEWRNELLGRWNIPYHPLSLAITAAVLS
jgi:hypothetical protein